MKKLLPFVIFALAGCTHGTPNRQVASESAATQDAGCLSRVVAANCYLSNNDIQRAFENASECKQLNVKGLTMEAFRLQESGKVIVVTTRDERFPGHTFQDAQVNDQVFKRCPTVKYDLGQDVGDLLIADQKLFMLSKDGAVFLLNPNQSSEEVYELLSSAKKPYRGVVAIEGVQGGGSVRLKLSNGQYVSYHGDSYISEQDLEKLNTEKRLRKVNFWFFDTERSLWRDE